MTRRRLLSASLAAGALAAQTKTRSNIVIASGNGLACCDRAMEILDSGGDTLDAVVAGVNIQELDPEDASVGYGGLPNQDGVVELDSCVMHGPTRRAGSVASIRGVKTPSRVAKLVMERTDHVMMVSDGALEFAKAHGLEEENLLTPKARMAWLKWKESQGSDWGPGLDAPEGGQALGPGEKPEWVEWAGMENSRPRRRFPHHRRGALRRPRYRRRRLHRSRRGKHPRLRRAHGRREHAARDEPARRLP